VEGIAELDLKSLNQELKLSERVLLFMNRVEVLEHEVRHREILAMELASGVDTCVWISARRTPSLRLQTQHASPAAETSGQGYVSSSQDSRSLDKARSRVLAASGPALSQSQRQAMPSQFLCRPSQAGPN
jgi:hypothetical protein